MTERPANENGPSDELLSLTWRYAAIIDMVTAEAAGLSESEVERDRKKWPYLVEKENGLPIFDLPRAAQWMAELSGASVMECRRALEWEWPS
jgi:hypothetical protein